MCGIVGYIGQRDVTDVLLKGLKRLEYRGYDSAGLAFFQNGKVDLRKSEGKIKNVERLFDGFELQGESHCGVGHTRWATHGKPTTQNAHPHRTGHVILVHNGIIENFESIREGLVKRGHRPASETDSELFGFLVLERMDEKGMDLTSAVMSAFQELEGNCSVVVMSEREEGKIVGVRNGSPLVAAIDPEGGAFFASDAQPILDYTKEVYFLNNGDVVEGTRDGLRFFSLKQKGEIELESKTLDWSADALDKAGYDHFMLKEIFEQPIALVDTLNGIMDRAKADPFPLAAQPGVPILDQAKRIVFVACGTSWHAALLGKYWIERWANIPVDVEYASEYRYRDPVIDRQSVVVGISQSGETADTLAVIQEMRARGVPALTITNTRESTLARESDAVFYTSAGPEIGVAATKTFISQLGVLLSWAGYLGLAQGRDTATQASELFNAFLRIPHLIESMLDPQGEMLLKVKEVAKKLEEKKGFFFIGRGYSFPIALEGALKLKEIAYVHAEGYASGELKHGPIAMLDSSMAVVSTAPNDRWYDKTVSNVQEVRARGAYVVGIGAAEAGSGSLGKSCDALLTLPKTPFDSKPWAEALYPFLTLPILQLLSYELAKLKGTEIDQPRNLAKSVTVE
jgi:glucosamine--fructose-6-phosphate aminotransferase (isomerizing)